MVSRERRHNNPKPGRLHFLHHFSLPNDPAVAILLLHILIQQQLNNNLRTPQFRMLHDELDGPTVRTRKNRPIKRAASARTRTGRSRRVLHEWSGRGGKLPPSSRHLISRPEMICFRRPFWALRISTKSLSKR